MQQKNNLRLTFTTRELKSLRLNTIRITKYRLLGMTITIKYPDNIPCLVAKDTDLGRDKPVVMGYLDGDSLLSRWSWAPFGREGTIPSQSGFAYRADWTPFVEIASSIKDLFFPRASGNVNDSGDYEYKKCIDRNGRAYLLVPANEGFVPVRHGTDPICWQWLYPNKINSDGTIVPNIVYDSNGMRHPACKGIDYSQHGFKLERYRDSCGRTTYCWWPSKNGDFDAAFSPTKLRITTPYYPDYRKIYEKTSSRVFRIISTVILIVGMFFGFADKRSSFPALIAMGADMQVLLREFRDQDQISSEDRSHQHFIFKAQNDTLNFLEDYDAGKYESGSAKKSHTQSTQTEMKGINNDPESLNKT